MGARIYGSVSHHIHVSMLHSHRTILTRLPFRLLCIQGSSSLPRALIFAICAMISTVGFVLVAPGLDGPQTRSCKRQL